MSTTSLALRFRMFGAEFGQTNIRASVNGADGMAGQCFTDKSPSQFRVEIRTPAPSPNSAPSPGSSARSTTRFEQNRQTAEALERLAQAIFRAWFVDFEPVKAKAAGAASFPSMPQHVFDALCPTRFVDSEIGPLPEGWEVKADREMWLHSLMGWHSRNTRRVAMAMTCR